MSPEQIEHIFEKFYRANSSNTGVPGTGLGMTIVKYLTDAHHGRIVIDSAPDVGTTVRIRFPVKQPETV
jgi:signal transduction histidine kinase